MAEIRYSPKQGMRREQWSVGPLDDEAVILGAPKATVYDFITAIGYIRGEGVVLAGRGDWALYDGPSWKAIVKDRKETLDELEQYQQLVANGDMTNEEALSEFFTNYGDIGEVQGITSVSVAEKYPEYPANI